MKKITLLLTAALALGTVAQADFADTAEHWASDYVTYCADIGVINGVSDTHFMPDETLTVAQSVVAIAKLHAYFEDDTIANTGDTWYGAYTDYLENLGVVIPEDMGANCTRMQFFKMLEAIVPERKLTQINSVPSLPDTNDAGIIAFYEAGILSGVNEYGTFYGDNSITRAECSALLARLADFEIRLEFTLTKGDGSEAMQKLYLPADATALTIGNTEISADIYTAFLSHEIDVATATKQMSEHPEYERYFTMWNTGEYLGDFEQYLSEVHGVNDFDPSDFSTSDAQIKQSVEDNLRHYVALKELAEEYNCGLTELQQEELDSYAEDSKFVGQSRVLYSKIQIEESVLLDNLALKMRPSEDDVASLLANGDNLCAEYICFSKYDELGVKLSDKDIDFIRAGADIFRQELEEKSGHFALEYLAKDFKTPYTGIYPTIYSFEQTDTKLFKTLKTLQPKGVSAVMENDEGIYIYLVTNPLSDSALMEVLCENYGRDLAETALAKYEKTLKVKNTDEINYLSVKRFAEAKI